MTENRAVSGAERPGLTVESASPAPIVLQIAVGSPNGYSDGRNCGSSGQCQLNAASRSYATKFDKLTNVCSALAGRSSVH